MIVIIRIQAQEKPAQLWDAILARKDELQTALGTKGKLLYLSKRHNYNEASLFVHIADPNVLGDFIARHLATVPEVTGLWLINMITPIFYPLPKDTSRMKRYTVTARVFPARLSETYDKLAHLALPPTMKMSYLAYTYHLFGDCIQFSLLSENNGGVVQKYVAETVNAIPGILRSTVCEIDDTYPLISYEDWQKYVSRTATLVGWDEKHMVAQFQN